MTTTRAVSRFVAGLDCRDLGGEVVQAAKQAILDSLACTVGGARTLPARLVARLALEQGGRPEATVVGCEQRLPAAQAAMVNATAANALDFDDTLHGHPGATTVPVVLAACELAGAGGETAIAATVAGYEVAVRMAACTEPLLPRYREMWDLGTMQAFGSAAAAARALGLRAEQVEHALGLVSATAPVPLPRKDRRLISGRSMIKSAYGPASRAGLEAALLARLGFQGPEAALDDNLGFWKASPAPRLGLRTMADRLGEVFAVQRLEYKPYPACRFLHGMLQALDAIREEARPAPEAIERITVHTFSLLADEYHDIRRPASGTDAQFSAPYCAAALIRLGCLGPDAYSEQALRDPGTLALVDRVEIVVDQRFEAGFPERLGARVELADRSGRRWVAEVDHPRGGPDQPLSWEAIAGKLAGQAREVMGERYREVMARVAELDRLHDVGSLTELLRYRQA